MDVVWSNIEGFSLPVFQICKSTNDVTLSSRDFGRRCVVYNVGWFFDLTDSSNPSSDAWTGAVQYVVAAWGTAEAGVTHLDLMNTWASYSKKKY